jgi:hypothetical protein
LVVQLVLFDTVKEIILDVLQGSQRPLQSKEIAILMKEVHNIDIKQYKVRDILWGELKTDLIYRGKPHWDYKIKANFKVNSTLKSRTVQHIEIIGQPLCSIQISYLNSEVIYFINKANEHYSNTNESVIIFFLEAWEKMLLNNETSVDVFNEYITYLK